MGMFFIILIGIFCVFFLWPVTSTADEKAPETPTVTAKAVKSMSRADVEKMLQNIERQKAPVKLRTALCYKVAVTPDRAEYVCPACGEKTLYTDKAAQFINRNLEKVRIEFANLKNATNLQIELDESSFCRKCHPEAAKPVLVLRVTYEDGRKYECRNIYVSDITLLSSFFEGGLTYLDSRGYEQPLKARLNRLKELLGFEVEAKKKDKK